MTRFPAPLRLIGMTSGVALLAACTPSGMDWDLRSGLDTSTAAQAAVDARPRPDARGVISYPGYQVATARRGDTVAMLAARVGLGADEVARYNALRPEDPLRDGEVIALPRRVSENAGMAASGAAIGAGTVTPLDVGAIATTALDRVGTAATPAAVRPTGAEPVRHRVARGETAFTIARTYGVSARALADWNGLGQEMGVREGQYLIVPTASGIQPTAAVTPPGAGSPTPEPPSARQPLPDEQPAPAAEKPKETPPSPNLGAERTSASAARFAMPVQGSIIRGYEKRKNDGIDIAAAAGTPVKVAADGTVAAITKSTDQTPIIVVRHADNLLTVYAGVDKITVTKGATVVRGQTIAVIGAGSPSFLHFEVRRGADSLDPMPFLQ